jgi:hypothetical protein
LDVDDCVDHLVDGALPGVAAITDVEDVGGPTHWLATSSCGVELGTSGELHALQQLVQRRVDTVYIVRVFLPPVSDLVLSREITEVFGIGATSLSPEAVVRALDGIAFEADVTVAAEEVGGVSHTVVTFQRNLKSDATKIACHSYIGQLHHLGPNLIAAEVEGSQRTLANGIVRRELLRSLDIDAGSFQVLGLEPFQLTREGLIDVAWPDTKIWHLDAAQVNGTL